MQSYKCTGNLLLCLVMLLKVQCSFMLPTLHWLIIDHQFWLIDWLDVDSFLHRVANFLGVAFLTSVLLLCFFFTSFSKRRKTRGWQNSQRPPLKQKIPLHHWISSLSHALITYFSVILNLHSDSLPSLSVLYRLWSFDLLCLPHYIVHFETIEILLKSF